MSLPIDPSYGGTVGVVPLPPFVRGDSWQGFIMGPIIEGGMPPPVALVSVIISFRRQPDSTPAYVLGSSLPTPAGQGLVTIQDAAAWTLVVPGQSLPLAAGIWGFDIQTTDAAGVIWTPIMGSLIVIPDYTHA